MEKLDQKYQIELDTLRGVIQSSDLLTAHLDTEEESTYLALREAFEPQIESLYEKVADNHPLQLTTLEDALLHSEFEGLYLIRVLGFSVLRGEIDSEYRYKRPQDHFKQVLLAIAQSSNFDFIKPKIGQTVQIGFGLSSEIWVSNLINQVENKKVRHFLEEMVLTKFHSMQSRKVAYENYLRQFHAHNFQSAEFPKSLGELKSLFSSLEKFLQYRISTNRKNDSLLPSLKELLNQENFKNEPEYQKILILFSRYFPHQDHAAWIKDLFNQARRLPDFDSFYFTYLLELESKGLLLDNASEMNVHALLDHSIDDDILKYARLVDIIHQKGYIHEDAIEAARVFYENHDGLSDINESLRSTIYANFARLMKNLPVEDYKTFTGNDHRKSEDEGYRDDSIARYMKLYMDIFDNKEFNNRLRDLSLEYVQKALAQFTDKRSAQYQDIKHFVMDRFPQWDFMKEKETVDMFKTVRKRKS